MTYPHPTEHSVLGAAAISGDVIVVGDYGAQTPESYQGAAYVYRYDAGAQEWNLEASLTASDGDYGDKLGKSVAVYGDVVIVGAPGDEYDEISQSGSAYVFRLMDGQWHEEAELTADDANEYDYLGSSVSILEAVVLLGAPGEATYLRAAYLFRFNGEEWVHEARLMGSAPVSWPYFGRRVSIDRSATIALIGTPSGHDAPLREMCLQSPEWHQCREWEGD